MASKVVQEIVVPDVHNNYRIYNRLDRIIDKETSRVVLVGDLRDQIDMHFIKKNSPPELKSAFAKMDASQAKLSDIVKEHGSMDGFLEAMRAGKLSKPHEKVVNDYVQSMNALDAVQDDLFAKESAVDYDTHEKHLSDIAKKHKHVHLVGVPGNHDTVFIKEQVKSVDWLVYSQSLENEKVVGGFVCRENVGELQPGFNGPNLKYVPFMDDDYDNLEQSQLWQDWKDVHTDLFIVHCGPNGKSRKFKGGLGITKLAEKQKCVIYSGHDHDGIIYREKNGTLIIRPGTKHMAKVWRDGNEVVRIQMYRIPGTYSKAA